MLYTLSHELTHYIKEWSPAKFQLLANFLMEQYGKQGQSVDELVQAQIRKAKSNGRTIDYDTAYEEVIADSMESMLTDGKVIEKLQQLYNQNRTLFEKISDFINKWVDKVKQIYSRYSPNSKEGKLVLEMKDSLEELQSKFAEAIYAASENVTDSSKESYSTTQNPTSNLDVRYSIRTDSQGSYVKIDANQDVFNGKSIREMQKIACQLIKDNFKGKVLSVGANGRAYVNKHSAEEYAYPANRRMNNDIKEAKMRSSTELDNLLAISEFVENQPDDGRHLQATGGWDIYTTRFEVANTMFIGEVKIMVTDRGYVFYDITQIERLPVNGGQTEFDSAAASGNLSNNSILNSSSKSQEKFSDREIADISNNDYAKMYRHFGSAKNYDVAGYLLGNGVMLDFSGKHWGDKYSTSRQVDHRDVQEVIGNRDSVNGVNAMIDMIGNGNIRLMPETGGINLAVKPNATQMSQLRGYINHFKGEVMIDIDKVGGDTIHSWKYTKGTSASKVLSDLNAYFDNGVIPEQDTANGTNIRQFLYSDRDYSFDPELVADLQADADKLKSDVANLKELLKLQQTVTHGTVFTKTSVNAAASKLMKIFGMNQGKVELATALNEFYRFL